MTVLYSGLPAWAPPHFWTVNPLEPVESHSQSCNFPGGHRGCCHHPGGDGKEWGMRESLSDQEGGTVGRGKGPHSSLCRKGCGFRLPRGQASSSKRLSLDLAGQC